MITSSSEQSNPIYYALILFAVLISLGACSDLYKEGNGQYDVESATGADQSHDFRSLGINPLKVSGYRKLFPRLVEKISKSNIHYITYDGEQIDNADLQQYVDMSASFYVKGITEIDPLFGEFEYHVHLSSPENFELAKIYREKWRKEWYSDFMVETPKGDTVLILDLLKLKEKYGLKIDSSGYHNGVSALVPKGSVSIFYGKNKLVKPDHNINFAGVNYKVETYNID